MNSRERMSPARKWLVCLGAFLMVAPIACQQQSGRSKFKASSLAVAPKIKSIVPREGKASGNTYLVIRGANFKPDETMVYFGTEESNGVTVVDSNTLKVFTASGACGSKVDITVQTGEDDDALYAIERDAFQYDGWGNSAVMGLGFLIIVMALLGLPLFLVIGATTVLGYFITSQQENIGFFYGLNFYGQNQAGLGSTIFNWVTDMGGKPLFIAIPLFTFAGSLMSESGAPTRLVNVARALVGWFPGGLAWVTLLVCCFFTAFTGASGVTIIALGGLLFPILVKEGYGENYSLGLLTTGGSLGLLIPPSLPVIVYGIIAGLDADRIWDAGIGPMILIVGLLGGHAIIVATAAGVPRHKSSFAEVFSTIKAAIFELPLPFVVVFGIKGGYLTATEAAALTAFWVFVVEVFIYQDITRKELPGVVRRSMILVGGLIVIIGLALAFTTYLTNNEVPQKILAVMQARIDSQIAFLLMLNIFLLIVGCLMDIFSAILVVVPLIAPVAQGFGVDPFHLAIIFLVNLEIGYSTPPVGINLFISSLRFKKPVFQLYRASLIFIAILLVGLAIITYWPTLTIGRFDLPEVAVVNDQDQIISEITITEGAETELRVRGKIAGLNRDQAFEIEKAAQKQLNDLEQKLGLQFQQTQSELNSLVITSSQTQDDQQRTTQKAQIVELRKKLKPLQPLAEAYDNARRRRLEIESLTQNAKWRGRLRSGIDEVAPRLDLSTLSPGQYHVVVTVFTARKHLTQTHVRITVKPDADEQDEDEDKDDGNGADDTDDESDD